MPLSGTVLVVDDEPEIRNLLRSMLESENLKVNEAQNGEAALDAILGKDFDVVISDNNMPKMTGVELYRAVCKVRPELTQRFILITGGNISSTTIPKCPIIPKPIEYGAMITAVRRILDGDDAGKKANGGSG